MEKIIEKLKNKENLSFEESKSSFEDIMSGKVKEQQIHDFLILSSKKGDLNSISLFIKSYLKKTPSADKSPFL